MHNRAGAYAATTRQGRPVSGRQFRGRLHPPGARGAGFFSHVLTVVGIRRVATAFREHRHLRGPRVLYQDDGSPLTDGVVQGFVRRAAQRAELSNNGPHMLRHTFCSHLAMRGAPGRAIQELAGHQDLTTTQRYMHLSPAAIDSAIRLLDASGVLPARGNMVATGYTATANSCR
jgi:site-specific recombinase XerD